jgi:hypothetical protein
LVGKGLMGKFTGRVDRVRVIIQPRYLTSLLLSCGKTGL